MNHDWKEYYAVAVTKDGWVIKKKKSIETNTFRGMEFGGNVLAWTDLIVLLCGTETREVSTTAETKNAMNTKHLI